MLSFLYIIDHWHLLREISTILVMFHFVLRNNRSTTVRMLSVWLSCVIFINKQDAGLVVVCNDPYGHQRRAWTGLSLETLDGQLNTANDIIYPILDNIYHDVIPKYLPLFPISWSLVRIMSVDRWEWWGKLGRWLSTRLRTGLRGWLHSWLSGRLAGRLWKWLIGRVENWVVY